MSKNKAKQVDESVLEDDLKLRGLDEDETPPPADEEPPEDDEPPKTETEDNKPTEPEDNDLGEEPGEDSDEESEDSGLGEEPDEDSDEEKEEGGSKYILDEIDVEVVNEEDSLIGRDYPSLNIRESLEYTARIHMDHNALYPSEMKDGQELEEGTEGTDE